MQEVLIKAMVEDVRAWKKKDYAHGDDTYTRHCVCVRHIRNRVALIFISLLACLCWEFTSVVFGDVGENGRKQCEKVLDLS